MKKITITTAFIIALALGSIAQIKQSSEGIYLDKNNNPFTKDKFG